jgi:hypothetical protein
MLCPKCGFISFDHLVACEKCHNDLSVIREELHGTAADVAGLFFLGALIKDSSGLQEPAGDGAEAAIAGSNLAREEIAIADDEMLTIEAEDLGPLPEAELVVTEEEEPPPVEFDFFAMSNQESSPSGVTVDQEMATEEAPPAVLLSVPEVEPPLLTIDDEEMGELAPMAVAVDENMGAEPPIFEIDTASLDLDAGDEDTLPTMDSPEDDDQSGQMMIDLESIDLSDLVRGGKASVVEQAADDTSQGEGLDLDDTMDLSLFPGDSYTPVSADPGSSAVAGELNPVDLTLVEDALVELAVAPSRKEVPVPGQGAADIFELSMEESDT